MYWGAWIQIWNFRYDILRNEIVHRFRIVSMNINFICVIKCKIHLYEVIRYQNLSDFKMSFPRRWQCNAHWIITLWCTCTYIQCSNEHRFRPKLILIDAMAGQYTCHSNYYYRSLRSNINIVNAKYSVFIYNWT